MHAAEARAVADVRPERAGGWRRKTVIPALLIVVIAAGATWLDVVRTIRNPDPLAIPERPPVAGVVWANRVFIHERTLKRWLETRGYSYAAWARRHPRAVAVLRDRPLPAVADSSRKAQQRAPQAGAVSDDLAFTTLALLVAGLLGAFALLLVATRRAAVVVVDRSSALPRLDVGSVARGSRAVSRGLTQTILRTVTAARTGAHVLSERLAARSSDRGPSVHRGSSAPPLRERLAGRWADARPALPRRREREARGPDLRTRVAAWREERRAALGASDADAPGLRTRISDWWTDRSTGDAFRERLADSTFTERMERLYDAFEDALETLRDYRLRVALWGVTAVIAAAGVTYLVSQAMQP